MQGKKPWREELSWSALGWGCGLQAERPPLQRTWSRTTGCADVKTGGQRGCGTVNRGNNERSVKWKIQPWAWPATGPGLLQHAACPSRWYTKEQCKESPLEDKRGPRFQAPVEGTDLTMQLELSAREVKLS